jgi:hypothetical protein
MRNRPLRRDWDDAIESHEDHDDNDTSTVLDLTLTTSGQEPNDDAVVLLSSESNIQQESALGREAQAELDEEEGESEPLNIIFVHDIPPTTTSTTTRDIATTTITTIVPLFFSTIITLRVPSVFGGVSVRCGIRFLSELVAAIFLVILVVLVKSSTGSSLF